MSFLRFAGARRLGFVAFAVQALFVTHCESNRTAAGSGGPAPQSSTPTVSPSFGGTAASAAGAGGASHGGGAPLSSGGSDPIIGGGAGTPAVVDASAPDAPEAGSPPEPVAPVVIAAAGDIAEEGGDQRKTADILLELLATKNLAQILMLGDGAYRFSNLQQYTALYDPTWGVPQLKSITRPIPGNHEYLEFGHAEEYFDYWNGPGVDDGPAGPRGKGYYSFDLGSWHFIALNSSEDCRYLPCGEESEQFAWLQADLAAHASARCTLAFVHNPRYQSGTHRGDTPALHAIWSALYDANVDLVLAAHEHNYQQFAPMDKDGNVDLERGMRSFVIGTGGVRDFREVFTDTYMAAEEKRIVRTTGILELTLTPTDYAWRFLTADGDVGASGQWDCH